MFPDNVFVDELTQHDLDLLEDEIDKCTSYWIDRLMEGRPVTGGSTNLTLSCGKVRLEISINLENDVPVHCFDSSDN